MILGPVSNAQHSAPSIGDGLFSLGIGAVVLIFLWVHYFRLPDDEPKPPLETWSELLGLLASSLASERGN
jgi:hypothetical protein